MSVGNEENTCREMSSREDTGPCILRVRGRLGPRSAVFEPPPPPCESLHYLFLFIAPLVALRLASDAAVLPIDWHDRCLPNSTENNLPLVLFPLTKGKTYLSIKHASLSRDIC